jgi:hypothetical protein
VLFPWGSIPMGTTPGCRRGYAVTTPTLQAGGLGWLRAVFEADVCTPITQKLICAPEEDWTRQFQNTPMLLRVGYGPVAILSITAKNGETPPKPLKIKHLCQNKTMSSTKTTTSSSGTTNSRPPSPPTSPPSAWWPARPPAPAHGRQTRAAPLQSHFRRRRPGSQPVQRRPHRQLLPHGLN